MSGSKRFLRAAAGIAAGVCVFLCILLSVVYAQVTNANQMYSGFIQFADTSAKGVPASAYGAYAQALTQYMTGARDDLTVTAADGTAYPAFSEKEMAHMADVRGLVRGIGFLRFIFGGAGLLILGLMVWRRSRQGETREQALRAVVRYLAGGALVLFGLVLALGAWGFISFDSLFVAFHQVAFRNRLWLLNPRENLLIMLMPTRFFIWYARDIVFHCWPALAVMLAAMGAARYRAVSSDA